MGMLTLCRKLAKPKKCTAWLGPLERETILGQPQQGRDYLTHWFPELAISKNNNN